MTRTTTILQTERLTLRNWREDDREAFHRLNSDEKVMRFFPYRRSREQADAVMNDMAGKYATQGYCFGAVELIETGRCIGICGINPTTLIDAFPKGSVEIGWRFLPEFWGKGYATEAAITWRDHAFNKLRLPELVSFAVVTNHASHRVMERIGMVRRQECDFDHPGIPDTHSHLIRHSVHLLTRGEWERTAK